MRLWRKAIVWLVLLWLPVQGYAAGLMPFACHRHQHEQQAVAAHQTQHPHEHHATHVHSGHEAALPDPALNHDLACDDCALCQMCGAAALPSAVLKGGNAPASCITAANTESLPSHIPTLPHRPPRALLV